MEIIKNVAKWGNGAGILLPREWLGNQVKIILIDRTMEIKKEVLSILNEYLEDILGIYIVGSYARGEQEERSDVDVLAITNKTNNRIKSGKYDINLIDKKSVENHLEKNILPLLPMIKEAKVVVNSDLIEKYKNTKLTRENIKFHIETTKSALNAIKEVMKITEIDEKISDNIAYSLILRLREVYIFDCLIKNKKWSKKEFLMLLKKISGSEEAYLGYLRAKDKKKIQENLNLEEAEKIYSYISEKIKKQENLFKNEKEKDKEEH
jgi:predicted nucleotidyltransferase